MLANNHVNLAKLRCFSQPTPCRVNQSYRFSRLDLVTHSDSETIKLLVPRYRHGSIAGHKSYKLARITGWQCVKDDADETRIVGFDSGSWSIEQHGLQSVEQKLQQLQWQSWMPPLQNGMAAWWYRLPAFPWPKWLAAQCLASRFGWNGRWPGCSSCLSVLHHSRPPRLPRRQPTEHRSVAASPG